MRLLLATTLAWACLGSWSLVSSALLHRQEKTCPRIISDETMPDGSFPPPVIPASGTHYVTIGKETHTCTHTHALLVLYIN